jgi:Domain of unknown function (DUF4124)
MRYMPALLVLITLPVLAANVWKWRDASGVVHYSDQPVPGAEQVTVQSSSTFASSPLGISPTTTSSSKVAVVSYKNVEIWKPSNDMTVANTAGQVSVGARVEPELAPGHRLALYMDGRLVSGFPERGMEYDLAEVDRGAHTLVLTVVDQQGKQVTSSAPVQFFVQQPSSLLRPR